MSITVHVRGYLGVARAEITAAPVALVIGANGAGKSSLQAAVAAALTGQHLPATIAKKDAGTLIHGAGTEAEITVSTGHWDGPKGHGDAPSVGSITLTLPQCQPLTNGRAPAASPIAAGLVNLVTLDDKARAAALIQVLRAEPSLRDLVTAIVDAHLVPPPKGDVAEATEEESETAKGLPLDMTEPHDRAILRAVGPLWRDIQGMGWDGKLKALKEDGAKQKGRWEQATGAKKYSAKIAEAWQPEGLTPEIMATDPVDLSAAIGDAKATLDDALRAAGAGQAELDRLRQAAERPRPDLTALEASCRTAEDAVAAALETLRTAPAPEENRVLVPCPHCEQPVAVRVERSQASTTYTLHAPQVRTEAEIKAARQARQDAEFAVTEAERAMHAAAARLKEGEAEARALAAVSKQLAEMEAAGVGGADAEARVTACRAVLAAAEAAATARATWAEASKLHRAITANAKLQDILAPHGLRQQVLARVLELFNSRLAKLCDTAGWPRVVVKEDMSIVYGVRPARAPFASESQLWRATVVLQLAVAGMDGSDMVLIDRADVLDSASRGGLFKLVHGCGVPALITMTAHPNVIPAALHGWTWLIEAGTTRPLAQAAQAAE